MKGRDDPAAAAPTRDVHARPGDHRAPARDRGAEPRLHAARSARDVDHRPPAGTVGRASVRHRPVRPPGARGRRLIARHVLPNTLAPLIVQATTSFPIAILAEAGLAYLGLGTQPPHPSWGLMLREAQNFLSMNPWFAVFPGGAIALTVLGLNLLGDGLRDLLDPKTA